MSAEPTEAERDFAADLIDRMEPMGPAMRYRTLAHALADQRAKYEAVADELEARAMLASQQSNDQAFDYGIEIASRDAAQRHHPRLADPS